MTTTTIKTTTFVSASDFYSAMRAMVSHFATCPKASEFSGGRKS